MTNKKGSTLPEAALVFPVVILTVVGILYILIKLYSATALQAYVHMEIRQEASLQQGTGQRLTEIRQLEPTDKYGKASFRNALQFREGGMLQNQYIYAEGFPSQVYKTDEAGFVRMVDFAAGERNKK